MSTFLEFYSVWFDRAGIPVCAFLVTVIVGYVVRAVVVHRLEALAAKTTSQLDDVIIKAIRGPMLIWFVMLGLFIAVHVSKLPEAYQTVAAKILLALGILSITLVLSNLAANVIQVYASRVSGGLPASSLTRNVVRIAITVVGVLIMLNTLGISVAPLLATLGVGGLAVALALQDTLSNLFGGFHLTAAKQIKVGDYVRLDTGQEGYVSDISWRTTKIRTLPNTVVLVPNAKLSQAIITNCHMPDKEIAVTVELSVHYKSDLARVEAVALEVARESLLAAPGGVAAFEPVVRFHTLGDSGVGLTVVLRAREFADQFAIKHEFIKRVVARFGKEGIVIPYPVRAVNTSQERGA
jgi:small-conductance mechanosensitive channel